MLSPTAVVCNDRDKYYTLLALADIGTTEGVEAWCTYVLQGIRYELERVDKLADYGCLTKCILLPAVSFAHASEWITETEEQILTSVKSSDIAQALPTLTANQRTYQIKNLVEQGMLLPIK